MLRVALKVALAAAAIWAVWTYVPLHGRTLAQRWRSAGSVSAFIDRGWAEATGTATKPAARPQARQKPSPAQRPTESHSESDRQAIERLLADHLDDRKR